MDTIEFILEANRLKGLKRAGWVKSGIEHPESVADHTFRVALMALALPHEGLDSGKLVRMAVVHDLGEAHAGDITPYDGIGQEKKAEMEKMSMMKLASLLPAGEGKSLLSLWEEYERQETPEARYLKELDVLEMAFQAYEYEKAQKGNIKKGRWTFWRYSEERIHSPELLKMFNELKGRRDEDAASWK